MDPSLYEKPFRLIWDVYIENDRSPEVWLENIWRRGRYEREMRDAVLDWLIS